MIKVMMGILGPGYFELSDGINLCCPTCGANAEKDQCDISLGAGGNGGFKLELFCHKCANQANFDPITQEPIFNFKRS